jgi:hypothetical protein
MRPWIFASGIFTGERVGRPAGRHGRLWVAAQRNKVKGVQDKPGGISDALKALKKAYDSFDTGALDASRLATAADVAARRDELQGTCKHALKAVSDKPAALNALVKKWEPGYK